MPTIPALTAKCPICDAVLELKDFDPDIDEPIECPECDNELDWEFDDETNVLTLAEPEEDEDEELEIGDVDEDEEEDEGDEDGD